MKIRLTIALVLFIAGLSAQKITPDSLLVRVKMSANEKKLDGFTVKVFRNDTLFLTAGPSNKAGKMSFKVPIAPAVYHLNFSGTGYFDKCVEVFTAGISDAKRKKGLEYDCDIFLFRNQGQKHCSFIDSLPLAKLSYNEKPDLWIPDKVYADSITKLFRTKKILNDSVVCRFTQPRFNYENFIAAADEAFGNKNYEEAKNYYICASSMRPEETFPRDKMKECDKMMENKKKD